MVNFLDLFAFPNVTTLNSPFCFSLLIFLQLGYWGREAKLGLCQGPGANARSCVFVYWLLCVCVCVNTCGQADVHTW